MMHFLEIFGMVFGEFFDQAIKPDHCLNEARDHIAPQNPSHMPQYMYMANAIDTKCYTSY